MLKLKNKCYVQDCSNYREIKLMRHALKLWERNELE